MNKRLQTKVNSLSYFKKIKRKGRYTNVIKDKAWAILSDYVRMRDFLTYKKCVSSGKIIQSWRDTDAGHFESMGGNGASVGFYHLNIHAQSKIDNKISSMATGAKYRDELIARYGESVLSKIQEKKRETIKADEWYFISKIEETYGMFVKLKKEFPIADYPDYITMM